jgi:hypothetical protein
MEGMNVLWRQPAEELKECEKLPHEKKRARKSGKLP